ITMIKYLDILGIDYIRLFNLIIKTRAKYILIKINYFSYYIFTKALKEAITRNFFKFIKSITYFYRWPLIIYTNNSSYFIEVEYTKYLKLIGTKLITSLISTP
ncbi:hypothetical protein P175DRAFT_0442871, partial [Aspergillus ochraceoroseus IBT 24754]